MESTNTDKVKKSEVKFITNDKLKSFIKETQTVFKAELEATRNAKEERNYEELLRIQYTIRQYIIENQHRIDFSGEIELIDKNAKSMPSLFGLYMMVVSKIENVYTIVDVMKQIDGQYMCSFDASGAVFQTDYLDKDLLCCCSHRCKLENLAVIKNNMSGCCVIIGSECIKKHKLIDAEVIKTEREKSAKYINKKAVADEIRADKKQIKEKIKADKKEVADKIKADKDEIKRLAAERKIRYNYRYYINVKYEVKEEAKEMGAKWDAQYKQWYIPPNCKSTYALKLKYDK